MTDDSIQRRKRLDHERYMRNREERLRLAKIYRDTHKLELKIKRCLTASRA